MAARERAAAVGRAVQPGRVGEPDPVAVARVGREGGRRRVAAHPLPRRAAVGGQHPPVALERVVADDRAVGVVRIHVQRGRLVVALSDLPPRLAAVLAAQDVEERERRLDRLVDDPRAARRDRHAGVRVERAFVAVDAPLGRSRRAGARCGTCRSASPRSATGARPRSRDREVDHRHAGHPDALVGARAVGGREHAGRRRGDEQPRRTGAPARRRPTGSAAAARGAASASRRGRRPRTPRTCRRRRRGRRPTATRSGRPAAGVKSLPHVRPPSVEPRTSNPVLATSRRPLPVTSS